MSFIGGLFSGSKGTDFEASTADTQNAFNSNGAGFGQLQSQKAYDQQQSLSDALAAQNGLGNQTSTFNQMQGTADQYQNIANGTGPNPAQTMLNQATGQNVANQAALMASQRGTSSNPGMIARQAAQQGAATQQQAAGQGATMQANQQIAGLQGLSGVQNSMAGIANQQVANQIGGVQALNNSAQGIEGLYNQGLANQNNANIGMQSNMNNTNAGIANTNAQAQAGMVNSMMSGASSMMSGGGGSGGGGGGGGMGSMAMLAAAHGGVVPKKMADGGIPTPQVSSTTGPQSYLGQALLNPSIGSASFVPLPKEDQGQGKGPGTGDKPTNKPAANAQATPAAPVAAGGVKQPGATDQGTNQAAPQKADFGGAGNLLVAGYNDVKSALAPAPATPTEGNGAPTGDSGGHLGGGMTPVAEAHGGKVPAIVSPGEIYLTPDKAKKVAQGKASPLSGERIPGKAKVKGDSYDNDTVRKNLDAGGVIVPRSKALGDNVHKKAQEFVAAVMAHQGIKGKKR